MPEHRADMIILMGASGLLQTYALRYLERSEAQLNDENVMKASQIMEAVRLAETAVKLKRTSIMIDEAVQDILHIEIRES